jgi:hypothetical protein
MQCKITLSRSSNAVQIILSRLPNAVQNYSIPPIKCGAKLLYPAHPEREAVEGSPKQKRLHCAAFLSRS